MSQLAPDRLAQIKEAFCTDYRNAVFLKNAPPTAVAAVQDLYPELTLQEAEELLNWGGLFANGVRQEASYIPLAPVRIEIYRPKFTVAEASNFFPQYHPSWQLYRDESLAIVYKPAGLPTIPSREQRTYNLKSYLQQAWQIPIHIPSRLDMSTAGLVPISVAPASNAPLQRAYDNHRVQKFYLARVSTPPPWDEYTCELPICLHPGHPVLRTTGEGKNAQAACTVFFRLTDDYVLALPYSGRTHQIRVHLHALGLPIIGDKFYEGVPSEEGLHLCCARLKIPHPTKGNLLDTVIPDSLAPRWLGQLFTSNQLQQVTDGRWITSQNTQ